MAAMIVIDANVLIYAYTKKSALHRRAKGWLERVLSGQDPVWIPWSSIHAFLRIITHPTLMEQPLSMQQAASAVKKWLAQPVVSVIQPADRYWEIFHRLLIGSQIRGNLIMDAHLAALTIERAGTLFTTDKDFSRFDELRTVNPLG